MANLLHVGAEFHSYLDFQRALDQYCQSTQVNGETVKFTHSSSKYIKNGTFPNDKQQRLQYVMKAERCKNAGKIPCNASYKLVLHAKLDGDHVLRLEKFHGEHSSHIEFVKYDAALIPKPDKPDRSGDKLQLLVQKICVRAKSMPKDQCDAITEILGNLWERMEKCIVFKVDFSDYSSASHRVVDPNIIEIASSDDDDDDGGDNKDEDNNAIVQTVRDACEQNQNEQLSHSEASKLPMSKQSEQFGGKTRVSSLNNDAIFGQAVSESVSKIGSDNNFDGNNNKNANNKDSESSGDSDDSDDSDDESMESQGQLSQTNGIASGKIMFEHDQTFVSFELGNESESKHSQAHSSAPDTGNKRSSLNSQENRPSKSSHQTSENDEISYDGDVSPIELSSGNEDDDDDDEENEKSSQSEQSSESEPLMSIQLPMPKQSERPQENSQVSSSNGIAIVDQVASKSDSDIEPSTNGTPSDDHPMTADVGEYNDFDKSLYCIAKDSKKSQLASDELAQDKANENCDNMKTQMSTPKRSQSRSSDAGSGKKRLIEYLDLSEVRPSKSPRLKGNDGTISNDK